MCLCVCARAIQFHASFARVLVCVSASRALLEQSLGEICSFLCYDAALTFSAALAHCVCMFLCVCAFCVRAQHCYSGASVPGARTWRAEVADKTHSVHTLQPPQSSASQYPTSHPDAARAGAQIGIIIKYGLIVWVIVCVYTIFEFMDDTWVCVSFLQILHTHTQAKNKRASPHPNSKGVMAA